MPEIVKQLNNYVGAIMLAATLALGTNAVIAYGKGAVLEQRVVTLEQFQQQQYEINKTLNEISKQVAVLQAQR
jgi:hypothetical protein